MLRWTGDSIRFALEAPAEAPHRSLARTRIPRVDIVCSGERGPRVLAGQSNRIADDALTLGVCGRVTEALAAADSSVSVRRADVSVIAPARNLFTTRRDTLRTR